MLGPNISAVSRQCPAAARPASQSLTRQRSACWSAGCPPTLTSSSTEWPTRRWPELKPRTVLWVDRHLCSCRTESLWRRGLMHTLLSPSAGSGSRRWKASGAGTVTARYALQHPGHRRVSQPRGRQWFSSGENQWVRISPEVLLLTFKRLTGLSLVCVSPLPLICW